MTSELLRCNLPFYEDWIDLRIKLLLLCDIIQLVYKTAMTTQTSAAAVIPKCSKESQFAVASRLKGLPNFSLLPIGRRPEVLTPACGVKAEKGRRHKMEDTYKISESFIETCAYALSGPFSPRFPNGTDTEHAHALSFRDPAISQGTKGSLLKKEIFHFYGVYDGHGGTEASEHCAEKMHENIREAWNNLSLNGRAWSTDSDSSFKTQASNNDSGLTSSEDIAEMFQRAFRLTDEEFSAKSENSAIVGSTALVSLVSENHIFVGYCGNENLSSVMGDHLGTLGDSRAVLCRSGVAFPLTVDHKPERDDETERIQKAGGQVLFFNGPRVMGLLAMSRAIGDQSLRPYVSASPDCCVIQRSLSDELLILATDGLWDVLSNQEACTLALKCLKRARDKKATPEEATRLTATVLTRAAMERGSRDNITVLIIDLRQGLAKVPSSENNVNPFMQPLSAEECN